MLRDDVPSPRRPSRLRGRWKTMLPPIAAIAAVAVVASLAMTLGAPRPDSATVFAADETPTVPTSSDWHSAELGVRLSASVDITITAIRFYAGPQNTGTHLGRIWDASGRVLATSTFPTVRHPGWSTATLDTPLRVAAGTQLVASYVAPHGHYADDAYGFDSPVSDGVVTYPRGAGVYSGTVGKMPKQVRQNSNYFVDISYSTASPSPTPAPAQSTSAASGSTKGLSLSTTAWWGGPSYYAKFSKAAAAGWTSSSFFPIAVFFGKPSDAPALKAAGINTYMGAEHDGSPISTITGTGMNVIAQNEWTPAEIGNDPRVVGWHVSDECEMGSSGCDGTTETARLREQQQLAATFRSQNDGRFLQSNFGNGVLGTYWAPNTMPQFVSSVDVTSVDKYAYTSPAVDGVITQSWNWSKGKNPATSSAYGWLQDRMETFSGAATPNWVFVETAKPFLTEAGARTIAPDQIEGAVWNAIIHGAAGIAYFQHNNNGACGTYSILQCGVALTAKITSIDQQVQSLAPVINTPSYKWDFGPGLETSLKVSSGSAYIFAMTDGSTGSKTFTLPQGVTGTIQVVGENRTVTPTNGTFTDTFPNEYNHHIYRIALN